MDVARNGSVYCALHIRCFGRRVGHLQDTWDWRGGLKDRRAEDFRFG
jgi:hypothetical protein